MDREWNDKTFDQVPNGPFDKIKAKKREYIKGVLSRLTDEVEFEKSRRISLKLKDLFEGLQPQTPSIIGGYAPLRHEVLWYLKLLDCPTSFSFPTLIDQSSMTFRCCELGQLVPLNRPGMKLSLLVPPADAKEVIPDVLLVPGLAFTKKGTRLGRGKGYYDRYLKSYYGKIWGICFEEQILDEVPKADHDIPMELIITDSNIYECC